MRYFLPVVLTIKDNNHIQINILQERIPNLSPIVLEESFLAYKKCALQDSLYTQIKMIEYHYHGFSVARDVVQAGPGH
ncbi:hypothetical protein CRX67_02075 [Enterobacteriaceae bacterium A-F18]|nr:hypothetical protein CRX67_02075 [Enterobacteriaceae bacterium A-F18]